MPLNAERATYYKFEGRLDTYVESVDTVDVAVTVMVPVTESLRKQSDCSVLKYRNSKW